MPRNRELIEAAYDVVNRLRTRYGPQSLPGGKAVKLILALVEKLENRK